MGKRKDILFIGALDLTNVPNAGDTVKNQYLLEFFERHRCVDYIDTFNWRKRPCALLGILWKALLGRYKSIVYSVSNVSAYKLTKILTRLPIKSKLVYFMIGGYTPIKIASGEYAAEPFKKLHKIIVEADRVIEFYKQVGISNTLRVYNFKPYSFVPDTSIKHDGEVKFVFLSRMTEMKGIFLILDAVKKLNAIGLTSRFSVDYYGTISPEIKERFLNELKQIPNARYQGFLNLKEEANYNVLADYDAMLFPTMHLTEGFPGVVADAAIAGVPMIASDWNYAEELLLRNKCGYVFPMGDVSKLIEKMEYVINHRDENELLRQNCIKQASLYAMSTILTETLLDEIGI